MCYIYIRGSNRAVSEGLPVYLRLLIIQNVCSLQHDSPVIFLNYLSRQKYRYSPAPTEVLLCTKEGGPLYRRRWSSRRWPSVPKEVALCTEGGDPLYRRRWPSAYRRRWPSVLKEVALCTEGGGPLYRWRWPSVPKEVALCTEGGGPLYRRRWPSVPRRWSSVYRRR